MYQRSSVAPRKPVSIPRKVGLSFPMWVQWTLATGFGAAVGHMAGQWIGRMILPGVGEWNVFSLLVSAFAGAIMGAVMGAAQGAVLARRIGGRGWREWIMATALGGALRWAIISPIVAPLLGVTTGWNGTAKAADICFVFLAIILFGVLSGIAIGIPQAKVLTRHLGDVTELDTPAWAMANAAGGLFAMPIISLSGHNSSAIGSMLGIAGGDVAFQSGFPFLPAITVAVLITWLIAGMVTGVPLNDRLRGSQDI